MTSPSFKLGQRPFPIDAETIEEAVLAEGPINFDFLYRGITFQARYEEDEQAALLRLVAEVGIMPYSAQSAEARRNVAYILSEANDTLGPLLRVSRNSRILLGATLSLEQPVTAVSFLVACAQFLLPVSPYLECLSLTYPVPPPRRGHKSPKAPGAAPD